LLYVGLKGHEKAAVRPIHAEEHDAMTMAEEHLQHVLDLIAAYCRGERPYLSRVHVKKTGYAGDYDHLARVREWSAAGESDE
jgi:ATP-dependent helicase/nuclease subunit B